MLQDTETITDALGISSVAQLRIVAHGKPLSHYKHFQLLQSAAGHHRFSLVLDHDVFGVAEDHQLQEAQKLLGKRITVTFSYKNIPGSPERDFVGVITRAGFSREHGNQGNIELSGGSPTLLLDAAPHTQSFGGTQAVSLQTIADSVLKEGLGSNYDYKVDPAFTGNLSYSCQYDETHYNYLARMAQSYGEQFFYDGAQLHFGKLPPPQKALKLTFGKDVEEVNIAINARHLNRSMYGYNSSNHEKLNTGQTKIAQQSSLAKDAYDISENTFLTPSLRVAPLKAATNKDIENAQKSATGSEAVTVFITSGRTRVPLLYPGCVVDMDMRKPESAETSYFTRLMITEVNHSVDKLGNYTATFEAIGSDTGYLPAPAFYLSVAKPQIATVTKNDDSKGRVQVKFDWQSGSDTTEWIRMMAPDAGGSDQVSTNRGHVFIPEVGDQVMIGFTHGHPDRPFVMGGLFHGLNGIGGGANNAVKSIMTRSGIKIIFNDDAKSLHIEDPSGNTWDMDGQGNIAVNAPKNMSITVGENMDVQVGKNISINAGENITVSAGENIMVTASKDISESAGGNLVQSASGDIVESADNKTEVVKEEYSRYSKTSNEVAQQATLFSTKENMTIQSGKTVEINSAEKSNLF
jgi:uncharacterized protein involved in type VI secretion and phage assembly